MHESGEKNWRQMLFLLESDPSWQRTAPVVAPHVCHAEGTVDDTLPKVEMFKCWVDWRKKGTIFYYFPTSEVLQAKKPPNKRKTNQKGPLSSTIIYIPLGNAFLSWGGPSSLPSSTFFIKDTLCVVTATVRNAQSSNMNFVLLLLITAMKTDKKRIRII